MKTLSEDDAVELAEIFHLLGDPSRLRIVYACLGEPVNAGALAADLKLSPSLVSHHLRLLRAARILTSDRRGRHIFYAAEDDHIRDMVRDMAVHIKEDHKVE
ncbi:ArsR/SmtB family transcription factor [Paremcibacter congregatus]|nr:metalloregulator ArsR/SmtB family transcription factor [Paremcibacter congregatus]|tara:strand:+ start:197 stop:502 length:306 start_codon:yes stop_codon:yes gene_type:complete